MRINISLFILMALSGCHLLFPNQNAKRCTDGSADAPEIQCEGNTLTVCAGNEFVLKEDCGDRICNEDSKSCDLCGNGVQDDAETCDDGNIISGDGCNAACLGEGICGDGEVQTEGGEVCDFGDNTFGDGCRGDCRGFEVCGDALLDTVKGEVCDDGNNVAGDNCRADCLGIEVCGDNQQDAGEQCDDGNTTPGDGCNVLCLAEFCGDGTTQPGAGETCDDGGTSPGDGCNALCQLEGGANCGDGTVQPPEVCDDNNVASGDGCRSDCGKIETCGDTILDAGENCDDGNTANNDGCNSLCITEFCGDGTDNNATEECDDNNNQSGDGCTFDCKNEVCGDGSINNAGAEQCDDDNTANGDGCDSNCLNESLCGNNALDAGETCDGGNNIPNDGCSSLCQFEANVFVSCGSSSNGNGTLALPFNDLTAGLNSASSGQTVMVLPQSPGACGSAAVNKSITIQGLADPKVPNPPAPPTINGGGNPAINLNSAESFTIIIKNIKLVSTSGGSGTVARNSGTVSNGLKLALIGVDLRNTAAGAGLSLQCGSVCNLLIDRSFVHGNNGGGLVLDEKVKGVISNSLFQNNNNAIKLGTRDQGAELDVVVLLSTFDSNTGTNAAILDDSDGPCRADSLIINNNNGTLLPIDADCTTTFTDTFDGLGVVQPPGTGNINRDPNFADAANGDFHLPANSLCVNTGNTAQLTLPFDTTTTFGINVFTLDFDSNPRLVGGRRDMGMFER